MSVSSQSAKFPASLESFQRVWEVYMKSGKFPAEWTDSEQSGKFLDSVNMCSMINMACKQMQFIHIYVAKAIYALFVAKTIYPLHLESFCAWYSADRKVLTFYVSALDHLSQAPGTAPIFSPCGVNGGNPKGCLAGRDLRPKGSRFCLFRFFFIDLLITDFLQMSSWFWQWGLDLREETRGISISECDHNQVTPCFVKSIWTLLLITKNIATIANAVEGHSVA